MSRIVIDPLDLAAIVGLALLALGLGMVYLPAAFVVVGAFLILYAVLATRGRPTGGTS